MNINRKLARAAVMLSAAAFLPAGIGFGGMSALPAAYAQELTASEEILASPGDRTYPDSTNTGLWIENGIWHVTTDADAAEAIQSGAFTLFLEGDLTSSLSSTSLTVYGNGHSIRAVSADTVVLYDVTVTEGMENSGTLTAENCIFSHAPVTVLGNATFRDCTFTDSDCAVTLKEHGTAALIGCKGYRLTEGIRQESDGDLTLSDCRIAAGTVLNQTGSGVTSVSGGAYAGTTYGCYVVDGTLTLFGVQVGCLPSDSDPEQFVLEGLELSDEDGEAAVYNNGILNMGGGSICARIGIINTGSCELSGGEISSVENTGSARAMESASITRFHNDGTFSLGGRTVIKTLTLSAPFSLETELTDPYYRDAQTEIFVDDPALGMVLGSCGTLDPEEACSYFTVPMMVSDGNKEQNAAIRPYNGENGAQDTAENALVLSCAYEITFKNNDKAAASGCPMVGPQDMVGYWKEDTQIPASQQAYMTYQGKQITSLAFAGWLDDTGTILTQDSVRELTDDLVLTAVWNASYEMTYGTGEASGSDFTVTVNDPSFPFADNPYTYQRTEQREGTYESGPYTYRYSHQGWQTLTGDVWQAGDQMATQDFLFDALKDQIAEIKSNGRIEISLEAVWDEFPVLDVKNLYYNGSVTEDQLLSWAVATDREGEVDVSLKDFSEDDVTLTGERKGVTITYRATDSVGNVTEETIWLWLGTKQQLESPAYARFIDAENFAKDSPEAGGMQEDSVWTGELKEELQAALDALEALPYPQKTDTGWVYDYRGAEHVWVFTHDDISTSSRDMSTEEWLEAMSGCKIK